MLLLATDTSGKNGGIALLQCEADSFQTVEMVPLQGGTFSAQLVPQIAELLSRHKLSKSDVDAFAVASGPGSFTGLRVGLAAIKALAEILQKPISAVSLLEVMAFNLASASSRKISGNNALPAEAARSQSQALIALDAGRGEVFVGEYRPGPDLPVCISESLFTLDELAARSSTSGQSIYTPDENVIQNLSSRAGDSHLKVFRMDRPNAASIARLGYKKILAGQTISSEQLDANYIRRADAEIKKPANRGPV
jgi:tRNA threonylcarbamoyladenosine biosynthesis protein TsaB